MIKKLFSILNNLQKYARYSALSNTMFKLESYITPVILSYVEKYVKNFKPEQSQVSDNNLTNFYSCHKNVMFFLIIILSFVHT